MVRESLPQTYQTKEFGERRTNNFVPIFCDGCPNHGFARFHQEPKNNKHN